MSDQQEISVVEKSLFGFARWVGIIFAIAAIGGIVVCSMFLLGHFEKPTSVTYVEVASQLSLGEQSGPQQSIPNAPVATPGYSIPPDIRGYFSDEQNRQVLANWLDSLDSDESRQDFLNNMSLVVKVGIAKGEDPAKVINAYKEIKMKKLGQSAFDKYTTKAEQGAAVAVILSSVFLLILISLMLVLFAIERHTRATSIAVRGVLTS